MNNTEKCLVLPKTSVRRIMKLSDEISNVSAEAVGLVAKATEEFLSLLVLQSYHVCEENNRKTIKIEDFHEVLKNNKEQLEFLIVAFGQQSSS